MYQRNLSKYIEKSKKSILLIGPRQVGKSTLLRSMQPELIINLMSETEFLAFTRNPNELAERLEAQNPQTVFIDEVQRIPSLLNTLQA